MRTIRRSYVVVFAVLAAMTLPLMLPSMASAAPTNDNFGDAEEISGESASVNGTNIDATMETDEPNSGFVSNSMWYKWTPLERGEVTLDTCTSEFDTVLSVYTGSALDSLTEVAFNDDGCNYGSFLSFDAKAGTTYYIQVSGYCCGSQGNFTLNLQQVILPLAPNDNFASAETITGEPASVNGTTYGATREAGEPDHYTSNPADADLWEGEHSVWYRWTASVSGRTVIDTCTAKIDSILAVYTGDGLAQLNRVADANDGLCGGGGGSKVIIEATEDTTYQIAVSDAGGLRENTFTLNIRNFESAAGDTTRVSVDSSGAQGFAIDNAIGPSSISADGRYVAFSSESTNLVANDTDSVGVFVYDRQTGTTERVSTVDYNVWPSISADGRYVAFYSVGSSGIGQNFVRDRQTGTTERVDVNSSENPANGDTRTLSISPNGRYVAFESFATNLVTDDTNGAIDIFVRDLQEGTTERVSVSSSGDQANNTRDNCTNVMSTSSISADGRYVVFPSGASNLVPGDTNNTCDVFVRDRQTGTTERVSVNSSEDQANNGSYNVSISPNGRYVAFESFATNLVTDDTNGAIDIFVRDLQERTTERVSVGSCGTQANRGDFNVDQAPSISTDGRYVAFTSSASNLVKNDTNGTKDVFVHDRQTGTTERVSVDSSGTQSNNGSDTPSISADGLYVAFTSIASNLVENDTNETEDVFVHQRQAATQPDDCSPPTTTASAKAGGNTYNSGDWANQDVTLTLTADDGTGSGVEKILYSTDGGANYQEYTSPLSFTSDGTTTITYYATDKAGHAEEPKTFTVKIDKTAPMVAAVTPTNGATGVSLATNVMATFSEAMDPATLSTTNFKLYKVTSKGTTEITDVTVTPSADGTSAKLDPYGSSATALEKNTTYEAVVSSGAKDLAGKSLDQSPKAKGNQPMKWSFKTTTR